MTWKNTNPGRVDRAILDLEFEDVRVESFVPESLREGSVEEFLHGLPQYDLAMTDLLNRARGRGEVLRYAAVVDPKRGVQPS